MRKQLSRTLLTLVMVLALNIQVLAVAGGGGTEIYTNVSQITDGLTYTNTIYSNDTYGREESFALTVQPGSSVRPMVMACDTIYGGMTISSCVSYAERLGYNVVGAMNTDFFNSAKVPQGLVIENGVYKSSPSGENAVVFQEDGSVQALNHPTVTISLTNHGSGEPTAQTKKTLSLESFNKMRTSSGGMYLYSSAFSTVSTRTSGDGWFVKFKILSGTMTTSGTMELEVADKLKSNSAISIGDDYLVLTAADASGYGEYYEKFEVGDRVTLETTASDPALETAQQGMGCGDILVSQGQITNSATWDKAIGSIHPRSVLGVKADGSVMLYVVDGRKSSHSNGLSLQMLANEMLGQGCQYAVNLDGGGSSALSVRQPGNAKSTTVNRPSDGSERVCGAYLLLVTEQPKDGAAKQLHIVEDGNLLLTGSSMNLHIAATDAGAAPASVPDNVVVTAAQGRVTDGKYYAPETECVDTLTLTVPDTGLTGTATVHVVGKVSGLSVKNSSGANVTKLNLKPNETVQLVPNVYQYGRAVLSTADAYTYTVSGNAGTIDANGVFTAGGSYGTSGAVTITGGGQSVTIPVELPAAFTDVVGTWSEPYVTRLQSLGIVSGTSKTTFSPDNQLIRGDFMLMLYNAAGKPAVTGGSTFTDVANTDYYAAAIAWAQQQGIAAGAGDGTFQPQATLTREQAFAFLYRALPALHVTYTEGDPGVLSAFSDAGEMAAYAKTPAATLVSLKIVSGSDGKISPKQNLTRAQMACMICLALDQAQNG